jgi:hypothetical protein
LASLQLKHVLSKSGREAMENALRTLPKELSDAYDEIIRRIKINDTEMDGAGIQALRWIFHGARPLQMNELRVALSVKESHFDPDSEPQFHPADVLEMCQSLLVHEESSGVVRFVHLTVQEFLRPLNLSQITLAMTCLTYLEHEAFDFRSGYNQEDVKSLTRKYPFYRYAAEFWGFHVRGEAENVPGIYEVVFRLLSSEDRRRSFMRMQNLSVLYEEAPTSILHIFAVNGLAVMCKRFLQMNLRRQT